MRRSARLAFTRVMPGGGSGPIERPVAVEMPVALEFDGIGYAVLMATPADLADLAYGFVLSERLIDRASHVRDVARHDTGEGVILRVALADECRDRIVERVRHRVSDSACGLCGIENLAQAMRPLPPVTAVGRAGDEAIFAALGALAALQPLNAETGAVHAAACCSAEGGIRLVREDVGRHNAFDKLIGAMLREGLAWDGGRLAVLALLVRAGREGRAGGMPAARDDLRAHHPGGGPRQGRRPAAARARPRRRAAGKLIRE